MKYEKIVKDLGTKHKHYLKKIWDRTQIERKKRETLNAEKLQVHLGVSNATIISKESNYFVTQKSDTPGLAGGAEDM